MHEFQQLSTTIDRLIIDEKNVRKNREKDSIEAMKASILANGIIQPIAVRPPAVSDADLEGARYRTFGGGRRFLAVQSLVSEGLVPADYPVPIIIRDVDDHKAEELSLAENIIRRGMSPLDEFRAFKDLIDGGATIEEIALRFGQTEKFVRGRLALANVHPDLLAAFEAEEMDFSTLAAFTLEPEQERQLEVWSGLYRYDRNARQVRYLLSKDSVKGDSRIAKFVGRDAYQAAGGPVRSDLFTDDETWEDTALVEKLAAQRLEDLKTEALNEGWAFIVTASESGKSYWDYARYQPEAQYTDAEAARSSQLEKILNSEGETIDEAEFEKLEAEYEALQKRPGEFTSEQRATSGVFIDDKQYEVTYGIYERGKETGSGSVSGSGGAKEEEDPFAISKATKSLLAKAVTDAVRKRVQTHSPTALAFVVTMLDMSVNAPGGYGNAKPSRITVTREIGHRTDEASDDKFLTRFKRFSKMKPDALGAKLAELASQTVDVTEEWLSGSHGYVADEAREDIQTGLLATMKLDPLEHFDAELYFKGLKKQQIAAAYLEMTGTELADGKKGEMVDLAAATAQEKKWLPNLLRAGVYHFKQ
ncbi:ParB/RepB/Spo0J family partition protein [Shinella sp. JR1-6]|uniref:ParB/RepB/Spo0J family partition protein n=1 Tax=Shinella sp. JR1-6 TaxID=2527671 RepID=UPI00102D5B50|nr:ParB/RepB/Spo0J family partition protein [Shinella sp. JR1-6]TAA54590.1 ParB/RepB/Spo0J family partition protein [Shinella sp. JR1-6]